MSEELVADVAESASARTLQETNVPSMAETDVSSFVLVLEPFNSTSLEESITASPGTVLQTQNTTGSSLWSSPFSCQKFTAASAESSSAERDVSSSEELLDAAPTEPKSIAIPGILPRKTIDGSSSFFPSRELITASPQDEPCEKLMASAVVSASMSSEGSTTISPQSVLHNTTDGSPPSASSLGSKSLVRRPRNRYQVFYIRMDRGGSFCMYPNLGGPFQSIDEANEAIDRYLDELWHRAGNNGSPDMKHPDNIGAYYGGHVDGYLPFGLVESSSCDDEEAEEERLRAKFKGLDDPKVWKKLSSLTRRRSK